MKKSSPAKFAPIAALLLSLSLAGCFGGEDGATSPPVNPNDTAKTAKKIAPGTYVGDYGPYDSSHVLESEFTLAADGTFRFFWFVENDAYGDFKGSWFQRDSNLYFSGMTESYNNGGLFDSGATMENDTNHIREVTDSSFLRKEWTPLRQKPYWIAYNKKVFAPIKSGNYQFESEIMLDSVTKDTARIRIELNGTDFLFRYSEDTVEYSQYRASWFQQGSILGTESIEARRLDTATGAFSAWERVPGAQLQRTSEVSDTAFRIWYPPQSFFESGVWEVYRKVP